MFRILFKVNFLTYKTLREKQPVYLHSMLAASPPCHSLRSNNGISMSVPMVKTTTGARACHSCAPSLWSSLPLFLHSAISVAPLKKRLETHCYDLAFPSWIPTWPIAHWFCCWTPIRMRRHFTGDIGIIEICLTDQKSHVDFDLSKQTSQHSKSYAGRSHNKAEPTIISPGDESKQPIFIGGLRRP